MAVVIKDLTCASIARMLKYGEHTKLLLVLEALVPAEHASVRLVVVGCLIESHEAWFKECVLKPSRLTTECRRLLLVHALAVLDEILQTPIEYENDYQDLRERCNNEYECHPNMARGRMVELFGGKKRCDNLEFDFVDKCDAWRAKGLELLNSGDYAGAWDEMRRSAAWHAVAYMFNAEDVKKMAEETPESARPFVLRCVADAVGHYLESISETRLLVLAMVFDVETRLNADCRNVFLAACKRIRTIGMVAVHHEIRGIISGEKIGRKRKRNGICITLP